MVHIGLRGHLPSCNGIGSCGIGGFGASIVNVAPIGFSFQDFDEITSSSVKVTSTFTARAIGFLGVNGPTSICSKSAINLYLPDSNALVSKLFPVLLPGLLNPLFTITVSLLGPIKVSVTLSSTIISTL